MTNVCLDPITRGWAVVTSAGVARLALGFVASLAIARALGPADYGVYAVLAACVGVVGAVAEGGLTEAAVLRMSAVWPSLASVANERGSAFFWLRLGLSAFVVALGCAVAGPASQRLLGLEDDGGLARWALLGIVATATSGAVSAMLQSTAAFGRMSMLTLANTGLTAVLAIALGATGRLGLVAALVVLGIGTSLATFELGRRMLPPGWSLRLPSASELRNEAGQLLRTGRWLWLASMFAMVTANAEVLLLNRWVALPLVGAYALALSLATKADLVNHSLYTVLLPAVTRLRTRLDVLRYARRGLLRSGLVGVGLLLLIPVSEPFILLIYGVEFAPAVGFFRLLIGVVAFDVLMTPFVLLPLAFQQPRLLAAADGLRAVVIVIAAFGLIPIYGAGGAIVARFVARVAGALLVLGALWLRKPFELQDEKTASVHE